MFELDGVSKLNPDWRQMSMLMAVGRGRRDMARDQFRRARQRIDVDIRARNISSNFKRCRCFSKEGALTQDNSGSIGTTSSEPGRIGQSDEFAVGPSLRAGPKA